MLFKDKLLDVKDLGSTHTFSSVKVMPRDNNGKCLTM